MRTNSRKLGPKRLRQPRAQRGRSPVEKSLWPWIPQKFSQPKLLGSTDKVPPETPKPTAESLSRCDTLPMARARLSYQSRFCSAFLHVSSISFSKAERSRGALISVLATTLSPEPVCPGFWGCAERAVTAFGSGPEENGTTFSGSGSTLTVQTPSAFAAMSLGCLLDVTALTGPSSIGSDIAISPLECERTSPL